MTALTDNLRQDKGKLTERNPWNRLLRIETIFNFGRLGLRVDAQPAFESCLNNAEVKTGPHEM